LRAASCHLSVSELIDEAVRLSMREDHDDLAAFQKAAAEPEISDEDVLNDLKSNGKI